MLICRWKMNTLTIPANDLIAHEAQISEQLMIMCFAIGETAFLVVTMAQKWFFAFGAHKVLNMPMFAQRGNDTLLDRPTAGTTNRYAHLVVTPQTIQFVHVVGRETGTAFDLASRRVEFNVA